MKALILGGGISGLTAAQTVRALGQDYLVLEQCPTPGGLTRTIEVGEFLFDYTGHFLHLCRYQTPGAIPYAGLNDCEWQRVDRRSACYVAGKMIPAPIQYNLGYLPPDVLQECVRSYDRRPPLPPHGRATFAEYVVGGFGQYLADLFLIPQNEKTMAISLDRLSARAVKRFFPPPVESLVRAGIECRNAAAAGYNSQFWYPRSGGIGCLVQGLRCGLEHLHTNQEVAAVDLSRRRLATTTGEERSWDVLFSSIPLDSLCRSTGDPELVAAAAHLSHSSTVSFNIGLRGPLAADLRDLHWVYVPDRSIPFYRVGVYSNISRQACTPGCVALYAEVGLPGGTVSADLVGGLQERVIGALERLGWIDRAAVVCLVVHVIRHAYVHHTPSREAVLDRIFTRLRECGVYPIGRYGCWDYTSMEDSLDSASRTVREVLA
jgi:protoporphyrinogen oxidase